MPNRGPSTQCVLYICLLVSKPAHCSVLQAPDAVAEYTHTHTHTHTCLEPISQMRFWKNTDLCPPRVTGDEKKVSPAPTHRTNHKQPHQGRLMLPVLLCLKYLYKVSERVWGEASSRIQGMGEGSCHMSSQSKANQNPCTEGQSLREHKGGDRTSSFYKVCPPTLPKGFQAGHNQKKDTKGQDSRGTKMRM